MKNKFLIILVLALSLVSCSKLTRQRPFIKEKIEVNLIDNIIDEQLIIVHENLIEIEEKGVLTFKYSEDSKKIILTKSYDEVDQFLSALYRKIYYDKEVREKLNLNELSEVNLEEYITIKKALLISKTFQERYKDLEREELIEKFPKLNKEYEILSEDNYKKYGFAKTNIEINRLDK